MFKWGSKLEGVSFKASQEAHEDEEHDLVCLLSQDRSKGIQARSA